MLGDLRMLAGLRALRRCWHPLGLRARRIPRTLRAPCPARTPRPSRPLQPPVPPPSLLLLWPHPDRCTDRYTIGVGINERIGGRFGDRDDRNGRNGHGDHRKRGVGAGRTGRTGAAGAERGHLLGGDDEPGAGGASVGGGDGQGVHAGRQRRRGAAGGAAAAAWAPVLARHRPHTGAALFQHRPQPGSGGQVQQVDGGSAAQPPHERGRQQAGDQFRLAGSQGPPYLLWSARLDSQCRQRGDHGRLPDRHRLARGRSVGGGDAVQFGEPGQGHLVHRRVRARGRAGCGRFAGQRCDVGEWGLTGQRGGVGERRFAGQRRFALGALGGGGL